MGRRQIRRALMVLAVMSIVYGLTLLRPPEAVPAASERVSQTVTLQALSGVAIEMDVCETALQARVSAARLVSRGSAGFVREDGGYRVLGTMFDTREEAEAMRNKLVNGGMTVECYPCEGQALTLKVTAEPRQIDALTSAIHAVDMAAVQPGRIAQQLDAAEINGDRARGLMAMLVSDLETAQADFRDTGAQGALSEQLDALMTGALHALEPLTEEADWTNLTLAGEIRCAGMEIWFLREDMITRLNAT